MIALDLDAVVEVLGRCRAQDVRLVERQQHTRTVDHSNDSCIGSAITSRGAANDRGDVCGTGGCTDDVGVVQDQLGLVGAGHRVGGWGRSGGGMYTGKPCLSGN